MAFPSEAFTYTGGCNCSSIRYRISVPPEASRPENPYGKSAPPTRLPMGAICNCNDCRHAHGQAIGFAIINALEWVEFSFSQQPWIPASELFDKTTGPVLDHPGLAGSTYKFFKKTPNRARGFCGHCGTPLSYFAFAAAKDLPTWWFPQLDIWCGTVDREELEKGYFRPSRSLWTEFGLPWAMELVDESLVRCKGPFLEAE